jgi:nickel-dependent lactate racemase
MTESVAERVIGMGSATKPLSDSDLRKIVEQALENVPSGTRVLAIVPDKTRDDNTHLLFPMASQVLAARKVAKLDVLIAQGTHAPMTETQKRAKIGAGAAETPNLCTIFDHAWDKPESLVTLGELSGERIAQLSGGLMHDAVPVKLNSLLAPGVYDLVLVFGATMPHEVAGFAGGAKYFFPGVAGPELTHMTHWLGAMAQIENVIGRVETPTRRVIEAAAEFVRTPVISFTSVSTRDETGFHTFALFAGDIRKAMRRGAEISRQIHIKYTGRKYRTVIALLDTHYDEMWVGGKASYKLGGIVEEGGELIIYAPHLNQLSATHGKLIEKYGYAPLEAVREMVEGSPELRANLAIAAHLAHVAYSGSRNAEGRVVPRYRITLASAVPEEVCRRVNLGYMDPRTFHRAKYENDPDARIVEDAGRDLYLVKPYESES